LSYREGRQKVVTADNLYFAFNFLKINFYHVSAYLRAILIWDFFPSACRVVMLCLNTNILSLCSMDINRYVIVYQMWCCQCLLSWIHTLLKCKMGYSQCQCLWVLACQMFFGSCTARWELDLCSFIVGLRGTHFFLYVGCSILGDKALWSGLSR